MTWSSATEESSAPRSLRIDSRRRWFPNVGELVRARDLLVLLSRRDVTVKYRQTILGAIWIFMGPIAASGLFSFVFGSVADLSSGDVPYFVFSYAGLLGWNTFATTLTGSTNSLTSNSALITKIYFPRLTLPLSSITTTLINTGISFVVMVVLLFAYDIGLSARMLLVPAWIVLAVCLAMGLGLVLGSFAVTYRDVSHMIQVLIPLLMFLTPVAYAASEVPENVRDIYLLNPIATIVEGFRWSLLGEGTLMAWSVAYTVVVCLASMFAGITLFTRLEWRFADVI